jgi:hypothetical protein
MDFTLDGHLLVTSCCGPWQVALGKGHAEGQRLRRIMDVRLAG